MEADCSKDVEERRLLENLIEGDADSFTILYYRYGQQLHAHLLRMVRSEEIAREVFQDVFMKIWEQRQRLDPEKCFGAFVYRIAENKVYDHFRKLAREKRMSDDLALWFASSHTDTENELVYQENYRLLHNGIGMLPIRKQVYLLCKIEGRSYEEVAALLEISMATVNDHIVKANRYLKNYLSRYSDILLGWFVWLWL